MTLAFNLSLTAYFVAMLLAAVELFSRIRRLGFVVALALGAGLTVQSIYIIMRWAAAGRAPLTNMFESLVVFAWAVVLTYFLLRSKIRLPIISTGAALLAVLALAYASAFESDIKPLMPALRSNWLTIHVFTAFLGYGAFAVAFIASLSYLFAAGRSRIGLETIGALEETAGRAISFGFLFLTVGIISGAVWANSAWGSYWQWDPKETWSLITWFVYAIYLHCRFMRGWKGRRAAWISIAGFASVILTYFGVNLLMSGLHSYA
jgi:cytochrome c-type biogenesis protein CcsB